VFVREKNVIGTSFHPELTGDDRVHRYFLSLLP
jgi:5'-phosphate synthase pdxT subunit